MRFLSCVLCVLVGCGPGVNEIVRLRSMADRAKATCVAAPASGRDVVCRKALDCAQAAQDAAKAIQSHQESVKAGTNTTASGAVAKGLVTVSDAICAGVK